MATAAELGPGGLDANNKPVFIASDHKKFLPSTDRQLTDYETLQWKSFQLYRSMLTLERRDSVYQSIITNETGNFSSTTQVLGTPFPVIDPTPSVYNCYTGIRYYEHLLALGITMSYNYWIRSKPSMNHVGLRSLAREVVALANFIGCETWFAYRTQWRLAGQLPNEPECEYYGVMEDKKRLAEKAVLWEKYAAYKEEWMKRWDYHVYGIRPGERFTVFSACMLPPSRVQYNTRTDFPLRKNPYFLSNTPLRDMFLEAPFINEMPKRDKEYPLAKARPEVAHLYDGPDNTPAERTK